MIWWILLIAGFTQLTVALPDLDEAPKLTLDELVGAGTFAPPTLAPDTTTKDESGIPPNPEAFKPLPGIKLPVFDPNVKWEGPAPVNENRDRFIPMPEGSFHIEFDKDHPVEAFNLSEPIHVDLSKYISAKFECGFCIKIVETLKKEIQAKGVEAFTQGLQKSCQEQKEGPAQAQTNCDLIEKVKVERLATESVESICMSEKRCKNQEEITEGNKHMDEIATATKEEDEMREKWKKENERARLIIEAQEEKWRRDFKRTHNDTMEPFKPFLVNLPEGADEGSGDDNWKPDFGGWNVENETTTETSVETATVSTMPEAGAAEEETTTEGAEVKKVVNLSESTPGGKFKPLEETKPAIDFVHEVLETTVSKDESVPSTTASVTSTEGGAEEVVEEPAIVSMAGPSMMSALTTSTPGGGGEAATEATTTTVAASLDAVTPTADEVGPEPTTLFASTEAPEHFTKSPQEQAGEEEARRTLQEAILEAKKAVDEDVGFMSKPVVAPANREGAAWANGPRVNLHEFVSPEHLGTASSPKATVDAATVEKNAGSAAASVKPTISPPVRAPVQCDPAKKTASAQFSAHPTIALSSDAAPIEAAGAAEPAATKLEVAADQEGPANMAIPRSRPMRVPVNRVVQVQFSVDDIAR